MIKIYLAARYSRHIELSNYAQELENKGFIVTSRWIKGSHQVSTEEMENELGREKRERFAREDLEDLMAADFVISFTEAPRSDASRGGRHVEFGIAWAQQARLIVVGYRENVFHCLPEVEFYETWPEVIAAL